MLHALLPWWRRPCVVQDLRQALCRHCWHPLMDDRPGVAHCCWCGDVAGARHGPYAED